jgi:hypothetical protein
MSRITDEDLEIRHSVLHAVLAALGYVPDDASASTIWQVQQCVNTAVAAGRMQINSRGHYTLTREYYTGQVTKNRNQPRSAA